MADITKCSGEGCPIKKLCYRYNAKDSQRQAYFAEPPFEVIEQNNDKIKIKCEYYWDKNGEQILELFHKILK